MTDTQHRVVVTGMGLSTPIGLGPDDYWDAILAGRCGIGRIQAFDPSGFPSGIGGEVPPFKVGDHIPKSYRKSTKVMARDITIAMVCAYQAVVDAKLRTKCLIERGDAEDPPNVDSTRFGVNFGAGQISADLGELGGAMAPSVDDSGKFSLKKWGSEGMNNITPLWLLKFLPNMLACHVTIVHDAQGISNTIICGEASSHLAIGEAYRTLCRGDADVCLCGGVESKINPMALARPLLWGRLNTESDDAPQEACRPFAANRLGTVVAEGGGVVVLERLDHAKAREARIYAEVVGFGASTYTQGWGKPDADGLGLARAMTKALADAETDPAGIDLLGAFGTGIADHDASEMAAWNEVFAHRLDEVPAIVTRGALGNSGAGAGAIDFATAALAVYHSTVPPSLNTTPPDPNCRLRFGNDGPVDARIKQAISVGQAQIGGQTAALVLRRFEE